MATIIRSRSIIGTATLDIEKDALNQNAGSSYYGPRFRQGAPLLPRCFWFVKPSPESPRETFAPYLETSDEAFNKSPRQWRFLRRGRIEKEYLFATALPNSLLPFAANKPELVFLPLSGPENRLADVAELLSLGKLFAAQWMKDSQRFWNSGRDSKGALLCEKLNHDQALTIQNPKSHVAVVYNAFGPQLTAMSYILSDFTNSSESSGFIADHETYYYYPESVEEGDYLCAILNSNILNDLLKSVQPEAPARKKGIHRIPFEVFSVPRFTPEDSKHGELAGIGRECRVLAKRRIGKNSANASKLRQSMRQVMRKELERIDETVSLFPRSL